MKTLLACEIPWTDGDGTLVEWSMRPFLEGLALQDHFRLLYRTFTTSAELKSLLNSHLPRGDVTNTFAYIGSHGHGRRLSTADSGPSINLKPIADSAHRDLEAIWVSACGAGDSQALISFLVQGGAIWAGGYKGVVSWDAAMLIDIAIVNEVMSSGWVTTKIGAVKLLARALSTFNPDWIVSEHEGYTVSLRDAIGLVARDGRQGSRAADVTPDLLHELGWAISDRKQNSA
jgi:hypothetical protein